MPMGKHEAILWALAFIALGVWMFVNARKYGDAAAKTGGSEPARYNPWTWNYRIGGAAGALIGVAIIVAVVFGFVGTS